MACFEPWNRQQWQYRYITRGGGPPNRGFPPGDPRGNPPYRTNNFFTPSAYPPSPPPPYSAAAPAPRMYRCYGACCGPSSYPPPFPPVPIAGSAPLPMWMPPAPPVGPPMLLPGPPPTAPAQCPVDPSYPRGGRIDGQGVRFPDGAGFIFPELNCTIHLIEKGHKPWARPGDTFTWKAFKVPIRVKVSEFMRQIGVREGARPEALDTAYGICEVIELGDGRWSKGTDFKLGELASEQTLEEIGWSEKRGAAGGGRPVWVAFRKF